ncbi:Protein of unknown function [Gryllus bimaculatus]|nr:Protein of unknown function [Gryllus bimaculatus]
MLKFTQSTSHEEIIHLGCTRGKHTSRGRMESRYNLYLQHKQ